MSNICFKYKNQEDKHFYYYIPEDCIVISDHFLDVEYCEEYNIIQKIQNNKEGFFDFSKNFIDIGACDGSYAMLLNFNYNYCFEPNKRESCLIYANTYLKNKVNTTSVYVDALSDKNETIKFNGFNAENAYGHNVNYGEFYEINCKTLDSFNIENVGLIKIDVEGFEEKVIRGGLLTIIKSNYPPILFECWDVNFCNMTQEKRDSLFNLLKTLGYEIFEYWGDFETHLAVHKTQLEKNNQ